MSLLCSAAGGDVLGVPAHGAMLPARLPPSTLAFGRVQGNHVALQLVRSAVTESGSTEDAFA